MKTSLDIIVLAVFIWGHMGIVFGLPLWLTDTSNKTLLKLVLFCGALLFCHYQWGSAYMKARAPELAREDQDGGQGDRGDGTP